MLILFLDESGDHNLAKIDPQYPIFVLGGCIIDLQYHNEHIAPHLSIYKKKLFAREDFIIHTADIARRRGVFRKLTNAEFRDYFYNETNRLMNELEFKIIACAILKDDHLRRYGIAAIDPYMLALRVLVERFVYEIKSSEGEKSGFIIAESRDETLDNQLRLAWMDLRTSGTEYVSASALRKYVTDLKIKKKTEDVAGLQVADLVVSPIGRHILVNSPRKIGKLFRGNSGAALQESIWGMVLLFYQEKLKRRPNDSVAALISI